MSIAAPYALAPRAIPHLTLRDAAPRWADGGSRPRAGSAAPCSFPVERRSRVHVLDGLACALAAAAERLALPTARAAAAFEAAKGWRAFGDARLDDHAREHFARSGRWVLEQARLHAAVTRWPLLARALTGDDGGAPVGAEKTKLLARLGARLEVGLDAWLARARTLSVSALRRAVRRALAEDRDPSATELEPRVVVTLALPREVAAAFDEVCDLARAALGREASMATVVEAILAEGEASGVVASPGVGIPADLAALPGEAGHDVTQRARGLPHWHESRSRIDAPAPADDSEVAFRARTTLAEFRRLEACAGQGGAHDLHDQLRRLIALEDTLLRRLGEIGAELADHGAWGTLPYRGLGDYAERRLGLASSTLEDRVRAARALARRPALREAYDAGALPFESALLILRATGARGTTGAAGGADGARDAGCAGDAGRANAAAGANDAGALDRAWLARACESTVKRLRDEVRVVRGRMARDASASPAPLGDEAWCASLRREPGQTRRAVLTLGLLAAAECEDARAAALSPGIFQRPRLPETLAARLVASIDAARRGLADLVGTVPWDAPWPHEHAMPSVRAARAFSTRARRVPAWVGLLALLENAAMTWDDPRSIPRRPADDVYRRAGYRCEAPGCTARADLHEHHLVFRSHGGGDELENRVVLCGAHHRLLHETALLAATGRAPDAVTWNKAGTLSRRERRVSPEAPAPPREIGEVIICPGNIDMGIFPG